MSRKIIRKPREEYEFDDENENKDKDETNFTNYTETKEFEMNKANVVLVVVLLFAMFLAVIGWMSIDIERVNGNEIGVLETWGGGVDPKPYPSKTYFLNGWTEKMFKYPISLQVFVMNDKGNEEAGEGRAKDAYLVQSSEGQDMHISLNLQWQIDAERVVEIHKSVRNNIPENLIRPVIMRIVKDQATKRTAIEAYSGEGLVKLQNDIFTALTDPKNELALSGISVRNFVIEHIRLDPKYISEITEKQVATQKELKAKEQTKAANAEALRVEAEAQAELKKAVVAAERDKQVGILNAEKEAQQKILAAKADQERVLLAAKADQERVIMAAEADQKRMVMSATAQRDSSLLEAEGTLAVGKAKAESTKLQMAAYSGSGSEVFMKMEIAKSMSEAFKNIKGYIPENMKLNVLSESYNKGVQVIVDGENSNIAAPVK